MILEIVFGAAGILIGFVMSEHARDEASEARYRQTIEELDAKMRKDLEYYRNLSESLQQDVTYYRRKYDIKG